MANRVQKKQIENRKGIFYKVAGYTIPSAGAGFYEAPLTAAINGVLSGLVDSLGANLANTENGNDTTDGLACKLERVADIVLSASLNPIRDVVNNTDVVCMVSKRAATVGLVTITGFAIDFVSSKAMVNNTSNIVRYVQAAGTLEYSNDGGGTYGTPVIISATPLNGTFTLTSSDTLSFLSVRRTAAALDGADQSDILTVDSTNYALGLFSFVGGVYKPFYNTLTSAVNFGIPVIVSWEAETPTADLDQMGGKFIDITSAVGGSNQIIELLTVSAPNTISSLSFAPLIPANTMLTVNGGDRLYYGAGADFTLAGQAITPNPTNIGYGIAITDTIFAEYFSV